MVTLSELYSGKELKVEDLGKAVMFLRSIEGRGRVAWKVVDEENKCRIVGFRQRRGKLTIKYASENIMKLADQGVTN